LKPLGSSGTNNDKLAIKGDVSIVDNNHERQIKMYQDGTIKAREISITDVNDKNQIKLYQNGFIHAREIEVHALPIPDYVFEDEYELLGLEALKEYIAENGHLPGVPSAEEFAQKGTMNLGEMNVILLEKVEELALYILELKKEIDSFKSQNLSE
jgi:hypothetical protein